MATPREQARRQVMAEIAAEGRRQLARDGAAGLSLRSVARELGMVSSGIYRYVADRDELLTLLLVDCYEEVAAAVGAGGAGAGPPAERWHGACSALRTWAADHPHEYALLYGSPVPGYAAPATTIEPARRFYATLAAPLAAAASAAPVGDAGLRADGERMAAVLEVDLDADTAIEVLGVVAAVLGLVSLERFGHTHGVVTDHAAFFDLQVRRLGERLGLAAPPARRRRQSATRSKAGG